MGSRRTNELDADWLIEWWRRLHILQRILIEDEISIDSSDVLIQSEIPGKTGNTRPLIPWTENKLNLTGEHWLIGTKVGCILWIAHGRSNKVISLRNPTPDLAGSVQVRTGQSRIEDSRYDVKKAVPISLEKYFVPFNTSPLFEYMSNQPIEELFLQFWQSFLARIFFKKYTFFPC